MVNPFGTKPPPSGPGSDDLLRRSPFGQLPPPVIVNRAALLDDPVVWTLFLKRLGNGDRQDAETISSFARRLGIDRSRIINKLKAHYSEHLTLQ
jgi:hypothetical protein